MRLSENFRLEEFLLSQTATRHGIDMTPTEKVIQRIQVLVDSCLQPLRDSLGATLYISSGFRPMALNQLIGGSVTSAHQFGEAADFQVAGFTPLEVCLRVVELELPFDQVIHEFGQWTHLGIAKKPRGELLTAYRSGGRVNYSWGLKPMDDFNHGNIN